MMAEVTSSSTPCSPPWGETKTEHKDKEDPFKPMGSLTFRINNFRSFSMRIPRETSVRRHCDAKVCVRGLTFGLTVFRVRCETMNEPKRKCTCMGVNVKCENASGCDVNGDGSWSCLASVTLQIKALLDSRADEIGEYTHRFFSNKEESSLEWEDPEPLRFDYLTDPKSGLYNEKEDTLEMILEISVDTPVGIMELPMANAIEVNKETVVINKNQLAMHSRYFDSMFYNGHYREGQSGVYKVNIEAPATVEHFKRMLDTMYPTNKPLDDQCIEGVLHLANQFLVTNVEGKCLEFLTVKSKKPALFKYRMADKYGYTILKNYVLDNLEVTDFEKELFKSNMAEYVQLGPDSAEAFMARYDALFTPNSAENAVNSDLVALIASIGIDH